MRKEKEQVDEQYLRVKQVARLIGVSVPTVIRWQNEGYFTVPKYKLGPNVCVYRKAEVLEWAEKNLEPA